MNLKNFMKNSILNKYLKDLFMVLIEETLLGN